MTSTRKFASEKNDKFHAPKNFLTLFSTLNLFRNTCYCSALLSTWPICDIWQMATLFYPTYKKNHPWLIPFSKTYSDKKQAIKMWFTCEPKRLLKIKPFFVLQLLLLILTLMQLRWNPMAKVSLFQRTPAGRESLINKCKTKMSNGKMCKEMQDVLIWRCRNIVYHFD